MALELNIERSILTRDREILELLDESHEKMKELFPGSPNSDILRTFKYNIAFKILRPYSKSTKKKMKFLKEEMGYE